MYHIYSPFNYLPLLTSGSWKLSSYTFTYKSHSRLDNHVTHEITASYKLKFKCLS